MSLRIELPSTILWSSAAVLLEPQSDSGEVHEFLLQSFPTLLPIAVTSRVCTFRHNGILRSMTRVPFAGQGDKPLPHGRPCRDPD